MTESIPAPPIYPLAWTATADFDEAVYDHLRPISEEIPGRIWYREAPSILGRPAPGFPYGTWNIPFSTTETVGMSTNGLVQVSLYSLTIAEVEALAERVAGALGSIRFVFPDNRLIDVHPARFVRLDGDTVRIAGRPVWHRVAMFEFGTPERA